MWYWQLLVADLPGLVLLLNGKFGINHFVHSRGVGNLVNGILKFKIKNPKHNSFGFF